MMPEPDEPKFWPYELFVDLDALIQEMRLRAWRMADIRARLYAALDEGIDPAIVRANIKAIMDLMKDDR